MPTFDSLYKRLRITEIIEETADTKSFILAPMDEWNAGYEAGQFITLVFQHKYHEDRRSYSFSSAPALNEPMKITIKRVANGEYSRKLLHDKKPGDTLISSGIAGFFTLPADRQEVHQLFFLAAGNGITPIYSLIKTALHTTNLKVILVYSNKSEEDTIFYEGILQLQQQFGERFKVEFLFSNQRLRLGKWLLISFLEKYQVPLKKTIFYLCGPVDYMLVASITLITVGVPANQIKKEIFNTRQHSTRPVPPDTNPHEVTIRIQGKKHRFTVKYPDTILSAAKKLNIALPYSCEVGNCGSCTATCTKGNVWMAYNEVLMDNEIAKGKVLTCQGYPVGGNVTLKY